MSNDFRIYQDGDRQIIERLHLHGIVWGIGTDQLIREKWNYGITFTGNYVNEKTINYITYRDWEIGRAHV